VLIPPFSIESFMDELAKKGRKALEFSFSPLEDERGQLRVVTKIQEMCGSKF